MSEQTNSHAPQPLIVQFEVVPEDEQQEDIADTSEVRQSLIDELRNHSYTVKSVYTGKKDGSLFEILVQQVPQFLHDNKDWLLAILSSVPPVIQILQTERDKRAEKEKAKRDL